MLAGNLLTTTNLVTGNLAGIEQILVSYPVLMGLGPTVVPGDVTAHLGLILNAFDPPPCTRGYESTRLRPGTVTTTQPYDPNAYCAEPPGSPPPSGAHSRRRMGGGEDGADNADGGGALGGSPCPLRSIRGPT